MLTVAACCCDSCKIFSDEFGTNNLSANYDQRFGSWSVTGGHLETTDANAVVIANEAVPVGLTGVYCEVKHTNLSDNDEAKIIIGWVDDDNSWYARVKTGELRLYQRSGGTDTQQGSTVSVPQLVANSQFTLAICYQAGRVTAIHSANTTATISVAAAIAIEGTKCGAGTGVTSSGVQFDDFHIKKHRQDNDECPACTKCNRCTNGDEPFEVQVEITDNANAAPCNTLCQTRNFTVVAQRVSACRWEYSWGVDGNNCTPDILIIAWSSDTTLTVSVGYGLGSDFFQKTSADPNCKQWDDYDIPIAIPSGACAGTPICRITAL